MFNAYKMIDLKNCDKSLTYLERRKKYAHIAHEVNDVRDVTRLGRLTIANELVDASLRK